MSIDACAPVREWMILARKFAPSSRGIFRHDGRQTPALGRGTPPPNSGTLDLRIRASACLAGGVEPRGRGRHAGRCPPLSVVLQVHADSDRRRPVRRSPVLRPLLRGERSCSVRPCVQSSDSAPACPRSVGRGCLGKSIRGVPAWRLRSREDGGSGHGPRRHRVTLSGTRRAAELLLRTRARRL